MLYTSYTYSSKHRRVTLQITAAFCDAAGIRQHQKLTQHRDANSLFKGLLQRNREKSRIIPRTKCVEISECTVHSGGSLSTPTPIFLLFNFTFSTFTRFRTPSSSVASDVSAQTCARCNFRGLPRRGLSFPHYRGIHVILQRQGLAKTEDGP